MLRSVSSRHTARLVKKSFPVAELAGGRKFREVSMILKSRSSHTVFQAVGQHVARPTRVATAVAAILLNAPALAGKGLDREVQFDIPRQPLEEALLAFSKQADVQILVDGSSLSGRESEGLSGRFAVRDALYRLLRSDEFLVDTLGETVRVRSTLAQASEHQQSSATAADENTRGQMVDSSSKTRVDPPTTSTLTEYRVTTPEVLIIGSRSMNMDIRRTEDDIQPYVVFEREQIQRSAAADLEDFFKNHLPMNAANTTIAQVANDPSLSFGNISLRGARSRANAHSGRRSAPAECNGRQQLLPAGYQWHSARSNRENRRPARHRKRNLWWKRDWRCDQHHPQAGLFRTRAAGYIWRLLQG